MKHGKAIVVKNAAELRELGLHVPELGPNSPLRKKPRKKKVDWEHQAQVRFYELIEQSGVIPDDYKRVIHAIPQFTGPDESWKSKKHGKRYRDEGQKPGVPDNHIPIPRDMGPLGRMASLYIELKYETYPSENQIAMATLLAKAGNAVVVIRKPDVELLAQQALTTVVKYLAFDPSFINFSHPKHTYLPHAQIPPRA